MSAIARTVDQAAGVIPLVLIPQLIFAGAIIPFQRMPAAAAAIAQLTYARWAYAGIGSAIDLNGRLAAHSTAAGALGFSRTFFSISPGTAATALACFLLLLLAATATSLQWRPPLDEEA